MIFSPEVLPSVDLVSLHGHVDADMETLERERTQCPSVHESSNILEGSSVNEIPELLWYGAEDTDPALHEKPQRMCGKS